MPSFLHDEYSVTSGLSFKTCHLHYPQCTSSRIDSFSFTSVTLWHHTTSPCHIFAKLCVHHLVWKVRIDLAQLLCCCQWHWLRREWADQSEEARCSVGGALKRQELKQSVSDRAAKWKVWENWFFDCFAAFKSIFLSGFVSLFLSSVA